MAQPIIKTDIEARVKDTGDTMTGALSINRGVNFNQLYLYDQNNLGHAIHAGSQIAGDYSDIQLQAKNDVGRTLLVLRNKKSTGDTPYAFIYNDINGSTTSQTLLTHTNFSNYITARSIGAIPSNALDRIQIPGGTEFTDFFNNSDYKTVYGSFFTNTSGLITGTPDDSRSLWWFFEHNPQGFFASNHIDQGKIWYRWKCNATFSPWYEILHTGNYSNYALPLTGGTLTGVLNTIGSKFYEKDRAYAINMNNSDIININSLYFRDLCDNPTEGIHFYGGKDIFDTIYAKNGVLYFSPQRTIDDDTTTTSYSVITSAGGTLTGQLNAHGNIYMKNTNPWILLNDSDSNVNFYVQASGSSIGIGNTWARSVLIDSNGKLILQSETNISSNKGAMIEFKVKQTDNNITSTSYIAAYDDHDANTYGNNMVINPGGNLILGGGEGASSCYSTDLLNNTGENIYLASDGSIYFYTNCQTYANKKTTCYINTSGVLYGAAWNDYAEYRSAESIEPGRVIIEHESGEMKLSTERLQPGAEVISDTFGFAIGETEECRTPIAATGRVLVYTYEDRNTYPLGAAVCSGPNGTVSLMTREEIREYPERIIGTVSEIPNYEEWGSGNVKVNNRIWIRIK